MTQFLTSAGAIVLLLGGLIFVHELGHFLVAKALGVKVLRFSIGFGPRLFGFQRGETEYRISALPLGGYVKMAGDDPNEEVAPEDRGRGFLDQSPWRRLLIAAAGPAANLVFPILVYFAIGALQLGTPIAGPRLGTVAPGTPAASAGLLPGDRILSVAAPGLGPTAVRDFEELRDLVSPHPGVPLVLRVERDGADLGPIEIVPASEEERNPVERSYRGVIGVTPLYAAAVVAPRTPGAAGPLLPFDVVVAVNGAPVRHTAELSKAIEGAACAPVDLDVLRERPAGSGEETAPGAKPTPEPVALRGVPTCAGAGPAFLPAHPALSTFVAEVAPGSPAERAGLRRGDAIASVDGKPVLSFLGMNSLERRLEPGQAIRLGLADGREVAIVPEAVQHVDRYTKEKERRLVLGFQPWSGAPVAARTLLAEEVPFRRGLDELAAAAWSELTRMTRLNVLGIVKLAQGEIAFKTVGGPIMIFQVASAAADDGWEMFLSVMALISVNLALMNLLPIPVLDGGHIAQSVIEGVTRRPLSVRAREVANVVGLILLFTLMIFVFKNDIVRLLG